MLPGSGLRAADAPPDNAALRARFERADLELAVDQACRPDPGMAANQVAKLKSDLELSIRPLLVDERDPDIRKRLALQASGAATYEAGRVESQGFVQILQKIGSDKPEHIVSALDDLRSRLLSTSELRGARAAIADVQIKDGQLQVVLRQGPIDQDLYAVVAPVVKGALERARKAGLDCTSSDVYRVFQGSQAEEAPTYAALKQGDLQKLYDRVVKLSDDLTQQLAATQSGGHAAKVDIAPIMEVYNETSALHGKALKVLGNALEMHEKYLETAPGRAPRRPAPPPAQSLKPPGGEPARSAASQAGPARATSSPAEPARPSGPPAASAQPTPTPVALAKIEESPAPVATLEARRAALIAEVNRQTAAMRSQRVMVGTAPVGVANNLLSRLKKVAQVADMLAEPTAEDQFACSMNDDRIHITYTRPNGDLRSIKVSVDERDERDLLLSWYIALDRKDDADFRISSEFNEIQASMDVDQGELKKYPNYHQLMVLMNRLTDLMDKK
jgi:hypothetical protein